MREILFRAKRIENGEWVEGDLIHSLGRTYCGIYAETLGQVDPETVGQSTGCHEFVMADSSIGAQLFEGDIVEVWVHRQCGNEGFKSKHDGIHKVRGAVVMRRGEFIVDLNNEYNKNIFAAKGNEQYDRDLPSHLPLHRFEKWYNINLDWQREHNKKYYYDDIVRIGNIFDNPKLMEV